MKQDPLRNSKGQVTQAVFVFTNMLRKLLNDGLIDKIGRGQYARIPKRDHLDHTDHTDHTDHDDHDQGESDRSAVDRDRLGLIVIPPDHDGLTQQEGSVDLRDRRDRFDKETKSNVMSEYQVGENPDDHPLFAGVPKAERLGLRIYLRGNKESDQETARERCRIYGVDYDAALDYVRSLQ